MSRRATTWLVIGVVSAVAVIALVAGAVLAVPKHRAQSAADAVYPGQLRVLDTSVQLSSIIPVPYIRADYAIVGDPDAVVRSNGLAPGQIRFSVDRDRSQAQEFRALRAGLADTGYPILAMSWEDHSDDKLHESVVLGAAVTPETADDLYSKLNAGLDRWASQRGTGDFADLGQPIGSLSITFVPLTDDSTLPPHRASDDPTLLGLTDRHRATALESLATHTSIVTPTDGGGLTNVATWLQPTVIDPIGFDLARNKASDKLRDKIMAQSNAWLTSQGADLVVTMNEPAVQFFDRGDVGKLRIYLRACPAGTAQCIGPYATKLVGFDVDMQSFAASDFGTFDAAVDKFATYTNPEPERRPS